MQPGPLFHSVPVEQSRNVGKAGPRWTDIGGTLGERGRKKDFPKFPGGPVSPHLSLSHTHTHSGISFSANILSWLHGGAGHLASGLARAGCVADNKVDGRRLRENHGSAKRG